MARISALKIVFHCKHRVLYSRVHTPTDIKKGTELILADDIANDSRLYIVESLNLKHTDSAYIEVRVNHKS